MCNLLLQFRVIFILIIADVVGGDGKISDLVKLIVAGIGSICTACLSLMYYQKDKDKELSLRYITGKRLDWINDTRKLTGDLCANIAQFIHDNGDDKGKVRDEIAGTLSSLYVRYNLNDENDRVLLDVLDYMFVGVLCFEMMEKSYGTANAKNKLVEAAKLLTIHSQIYLKVEWERVKLETTYSGDEAKKDKVVKQKMADLRLNLYEQAKNNSKTYKKILDDGLSGLSINEVYKKIKSAAEDDPCKYGKAK